MTAKNLDDVFPSWLSLCRFKMNHHSLVRTCFLYTVVTQEVPTNEQKRSQKSNSLNKLFRQRLPNQKTRATSPQPGQLTGKGLGLSRQSLEPEASPAICRRDKHRECLSVPGFLDSLTLARQRGAIRPRLCLTPAGSQMHAKYSSTRDMLGDDGDAALSLHSLASTTTRRPGSEHTEHQAPSSAWRPAALTLVTLCLVLLTGLAALGLLFFQLYRLSITQQDSISQKEERLGNLSQQLQSLQAQNRKLAETLQLMAEKLCRELYNKTGGKWARITKCPLCLAISVHVRLKIPSVYLETMYYLPNCLMNSIKCLVIKIITRCWNPMGGIRLSCRGCPCGIIYLIELKYIPPRFDIVVDFTCLRSKDCVTILNGKAFSKDCNELRRCACERTATVVRTDWLYYHP
ncbi:C-type lectin domain family 1 member A [Trichechus manatus latirostris]|uniref:C-type lectin domain family 1 member A n=1 Tax=Trichechus manatus latirostris TaxID=127582 RepID=A0A2Y9RPF8_TRIMA|nr:C-type lectin domain family 1 member A [Trichechus manatus latirostris]